MTAIRASMILAAIDHWMDGAVPRAPGPAANLCVLQLQTRVFSHCIHMHACTLFPTPVLPEVALDHAPAAHM